MVPVAAVIAKVDGVYNAVVTNGNFVGQNVVIGRGAGQGPTASAVVSDLMDIARDRILPAFSAPAESLKKLPSAPTGSHVGPYYLRLMVVDRPGVIADIAAAMRDENVSLEAMIQRARGDTVPVVLTTHETTEAAIDRVVRRLASINSILEPPHVLPIELLA
jgi:homoserine dehydrogenase